jgi:hypothetical protein
MAYTIQAIIAQAAVLRSGSTGSAPTIDLPQSMGLQPLVGPAAVLPDIPLFPLTDEAEPDAVLPVTVADLLQSISSRGKVAYVEAEIFGGAGLQACVTAEGGKVLSKYVGQDAINVALRFLGVTKGRFDDEFDALGLSRHRDAKDWR